MTHTTLALLIAGLLWGGCIMGVGSWFWTYNRTSRSRADRALGIGTMLVGFVAMALCAWKLTQLVTQ